MERYEIVVSDNNIRIENGYLVRCRDYESVLNCIRANEPNEVTELSLIHI